MDESGVILTAVLPMLGVVVGAALQYWITRSSERQRQTELLRDQAYADYLRGVAQQGAAARFGVPKREEILWTVADAKARITILGSTRVCEALARFERAGPVLDEARSGLFVEICQAMRADCAGRQGPLSADDVEWILLEKKPKPAAR